MPKQGSQLDSTQTQTQTQPLLCSVNSPSTPLSPDSKDNKAPFWTWPSSWEVFKAGCATGIRYRILESRLSNLRPIAFYHPPSKLQLVDSGTDTAVTNKVSRWKIPRGFKDEALKGGGRIDQITSIADGSKENSIRKQNRNPNSNETSAQTEGVREDKTVRQSQ